MTKHINKNSNKTFVFKHPIATIITISIILVIIAIPVYFEMILCGFSKEKYVRKHIDEIYEVFIEDNTDGHGNDIFDIKFQEPIDIEKIAENTSIGPMTVECTLIFINEVDGIEYSILYRAEKTWLNDYQWIAEENFFKAMQNCPRA